MSARLHWLLELQYAGRTFRWGSAQVSVSRRLPAVDYLYLLGFDPPEVEQRLDGIGSAPAERSMSLDVLFPPDESISRLLNEGHDPTFSPVELSLWREGDFWESRRVMLAGHISRVEYGGPDEPVTVGITEALLDDKSLLIPTISTDSTRWPTLPLGEDGRAVATIIGRPGQYEEGGTTLYAPAVPAYAIDEGSIPVEVSKVVLAAHHVGATEAIVYDGESRGMTVTVVNDQTSYLSEPVAEASVVSGGIDRTQSTFFSALKGDGLTIGGNPIETVSDVCLWALSSTSLRVDRAAWAVLGERTRSIRVGTYLDASCQPLDWIINEILPLVPVSIVSGPEGVAPVWWNLQPGPNDVVARFTVGERGVVRRGRIRVDDGDIVNSIRVECGFDLRTDAPRVVVELGATPDLDAEVPVWGSLHAALSQSRYGVREVKLESRSTWDRSTAESWAQWTLLHRALPRREISLEVGSEWLWLPLGSVVQVNDDELYWEGRYALLTGVTVESEDTLLLTLISFDQPMRAGPV